MFSEQNRAHTLNGIFFIALFAATSFYLTQMAWFNKTGLSPLVIAIILGICYGNTLRHAFPSQWVLGLHFSAKRLLRLAIILYGFRITFQQITTIGLEGLLLDILIVASTLILGYTLGVKVLKLDRHLALLISSGSAICGAAAVLAVEDVIKSESYKASVAVGTVVLFGTLGMFLYPFLQHIHIFGFSDNQFGMFAGASVHEVAQALVAGSNVTENAGNIAVIVKMTRVLLLAPVLFLLAFNKNSPSTSQKKSFTIPWFVIGFAVVIVLNSLHIMPELLIKLINQLDIFLLTMAMAAIGVETNLNKVKTVGLKPLYLATFLFVWLTIVAYLLVKYLN